MTAQRVGIIGAGVSGIAWAHVLTQLGFRVTLVDQAPQVGGQWLWAYPQVSLQNSRYEYALPRRPWPAGTPLHPTGPQVCAYLQRAATAYGLDMRLGRLVEHARFDGTKRCWKLNLRRTPRACEGSNSPTPASKPQELLEFDKLVVSTGQFDLGSQRRALPQEDRFAGELLTAREISDLDQTFQPGKRVVVVGFGKTALDMTSFAAQRGARVTHLFRQARWTIPREILGLHYTRLLFSRANGTFFMPAWDHPGALESFVHQHLGFAVDGFWKALQGLLRKLALRSAAGLGSAAADRVTRALPPHGAQLPFECRSALALAPDDYYRQVARGNIEPMVGELSGFLEDGRGLLVTEAGAGHTTSIAADTVVLAVGSGAPQFGFFSGDIRARLEREQDGVQLYRHLLCPDIHPESLAFAGFNHGFLHVPSACLGALWVGALWRGELRLPSAARMRASIADVQSWKRRHMLFEPSRGCGVNTRFQQYNDRLCADLGLRPHRKPNPLAEYLGRYGAADYDGIVDEYLLEAQLASRRAIAGGHAQGEGKCEPPVANPSDDARAHQEVVSVAHRGIV